MKNPDTDPPAQPETLLGVPEYDDDAEVPAQDGGEEKQADDLVGDPIEDDAYPLDHDYVVTDDGEGDSDDGLPMEEES